MIFWSVWSSGLSGLFGLFGLSGLSRRGPWTVVCGLVSLSGLFGRLAYRLKF